MRKKVKVIPEKNREEIEELQATLNELKDKNKAIWLDAGASISMRSMFGEENEISRKIEELMNG